MKKEYICFEENGVSFEGFYDSESKFNSETIITSIKVAPGVETVTFGLPKTGFIELKPENNDVFPWVKTIVIKKGISKIKIQNQMFPNVEAVISENALYETRDMLVSTTRKALLNSFCKKPEYVLDMKGIKVLEPNSLNGCLTNNIINTESVRIFYEKSFFKYNAVAKNGVKMFGHIILGFDEKEEVIEIPDDKYELDAIYNIKSSENNKAVKIHNLNTINVFRCSEIELPNHLIIEAQEENQDAFDFFYDFSAALELNFLKMFAEIEILHSSFLNTDDGIVYSADGDILLCCPQKKEGIIKVKEGTKIIKEKAFQSCKNIEKVILPDSLESIESKTFANCHNLKEINLPETLRSIGDRCFLKCALKKIEIPSNIAIIPESCFAECPLDTIVLKEGVTKIEDNAFNKASGNLNVPKSLLYVGYENFLFVNSMTINGDKFPSGLLSIALNNMNKDSRTLKIIHGKTVFGVPKVPSVTNNDDMYKIKLLESCKLNIVEENMFRFLPCFRIIINRIMTAIEMFELSNDKNVKRILKEKSKFYLLNRINERCEKDIIRFIETKIPSEDTLKEVLPVAQEHHLTTVSAYILAELKNYSNEKNYSL